jgi:hypothetical protein
MVVVAVDSWMVSQQPISMALVMFVGSVVGIGTQGKTGMVLETTGSAPWKQVSREASFR